MRRSCFRGSRILGILMFLGSATLSGCDEYGRVLGPSSGYGYGELTVSVRNITPYLTHAEWLCRGRTEIATLRDGEGAKFDCPWYNDNSYSNAVLTVFIDDPWGRTVRTQQWTVDRRMRSVSCAVVVIRKSYSSETVNLQCAG